MQKKLSQNLIVAINAISFAGAAIFGGIGIFAAIANFIDGKWSVYTGADIIGTVGTPFFLALLALCLGILAKLTIKKISDAELLKKAYGKVAIVTGSISTLFIVVALSAAIFSLIVVGVKDFDQGGLWLNGFLSPMIIAIVAGITAFMASKIASGKISLLPMMTNIVLCVVSLSALLMIISTIVNLYVDKSSSYDSIYDSIYDLLR